jgi:DNA-binding HxlR family transcriptional regulator
MTTIRKLTSTNALNEQQFKETCPMQYAMLQIGGRWKLMLLWYIHVGVDRYSALRRAIPAVTAKVLTQQLRELEADGLIERTVVALRPLHVCYALTSRGAGLVPILAALNTWASDEQQTLAPSSNQRDAA